MPYIPEHLRSKFDVQEGADTAGELNYQITSAVLAFLGLHPKYEDYNAAIGALECAKMELYRRVVAPYEDKKMKENSDVYLPC